MEIPEIMIKNENEKNREIFKKYQSSAEKYVSQGFDEDSVSDILKIDGCPKEIANKLAGFIFNNIPKDYGTSNPPLSFEDVRDHIKESIMTASIDKIDDYFNRFANKSHNEIKNRILIARDNGGNAFLSEVLSELEPLVEDLIVTNNALSNDQKVANSIDEKEMLEQDLFGVWPPHLIKERKRMENGDSKLMEKSNVPPNDISFI
jgi:hypothetical protein